MKTFPGIKIFDNVLNIMEVKVLHRTISSTPMVWSANDRFDTPINSMAKRIGIDDQIYNRLIKVIYNLEPQLKQLPVERSGIILTPTQTDPPYFHTDGPGTISTLFYLNANIDIDDGGETQFDYSDHIIGIKPLPGRFIIFDGDIPHRLTYFRNKIRIITYFKFRKHPNYDIFIDNPYNKL